MFNFNLSWKVYNSYTPYLDRNSQTYIIQVSNSVNSKFRNIEHKPTTFLKRSNLYINSFRLIQFIVLFCLELINHL